MKSKDGLTPEDFLPGVQHLWDRTPNVFLMSPEDYKKIPKTTSTNLLGVYCTKTYPIFVCKCAKVGEVLAFYLPEYMWENAAKTTLEEVKNG